ncbi:MAG: aminotransferase class IV [Planctomycetia bacterium]|nr:aminotransferase class IV [Planctomycetia bacterium]
MTEPLVSLNGQLLPATQARLNIYDAGVVFGATVTEMTRTFRHQPFRLEDHVARLFRSLKSTQMDIGMSPEELITRSLELLSHNAGLIPADDELGLIQFVTAGEYGSYVASRDVVVRSGPTVCIHTFPLPFALWAKRMQSGAHVVTPTIRHVPPQCYDPSTKNRSRLHYYLADQEARQTDPRAIALLLDIDGNVAETSGANFLIVERGTIVSPTERNTLPGVSRTTVFDLATRLGIPFVERDFQPEAVLSADEAFLSGTSICLCPVTKINGQIIGGGEPGSVYRRLISAWSEMVGVDITGQFLARL